MIGVQVPCIAGGIAAAGVDGDGAGAAVDVVLVFDEGADGDAFVEAADVDGGAVGVGLYDAGEVGVVGEARGDAICCDLAWFVEAGVVDRAPCSGAHVAVGVIRVAVVHGTAGGGDGVGAGVDAVGVRAHVALVGDVADFVVFERFVGRTGDGLQAVQGVVAEGFAQALDVIGAAQEVASDVEAVFEVLDQATRSGGADGVDRILGRVVGSGGAEAVAEDFAGGAVARVGVLGLPVAGVGLVVSDFAQVAVAVVDVLYGEVGFG